MRIGFAVFLFLHGFAHLVGVLAVSGTAQVEGFDGRASLLLQGLEPGSTGLRLLSVVWIFGMFGFIAAGVGAILQSDWVVPLLIGVAIVSLAASVLWYQDAPLGIAANVVILVVILVPALEAKVLPV